jgi:hypothetical protein
MANPTVQSRHYPVHSKGNPRQILSEKVRWNGSLRIKPATGKKEVPWLRLVIGKSMVRILIYGKDAQHKKRKSMNRQRKLP